MFIAAVLVIIVAGMRAAEPILVPAIAFSISLSSLCYSCILASARNDCPQPSATFLVVFGVLGVGIGLGALVGTSLQDFSESIPRYQVLLTEGIDSSDSNGLDGIGIPAI